MSVLVGAWAFRPKGRQLRYDCYLTDEEFSFALDVVRCARSGKYELINLFDKLWNLVSHKTGFGRRFKQSVEAGHLPRIRLATKTVTNHQTYVILPRT